MSRSADPMKYRTYWKAHAFSESEGNRLLLNPEELADEPFIASVRPGEASAPAGGVPVGTLKDRLLTLSLDEHTICFGASGSKKSRCVVRPAIFALAQAGDSIVITDPKGELASDPKVRGVLEEYGYRVCCLDFRTFSGDGLNMLEPAVRLFRDGRRAAGMEYLADLISSIVDANSHNQKIDPFWPATSKLFLTGGACAICDMYHVTKPEKVTVGTLANLTADEDAGLVRSWLDALESSSEPAMTMLRGAVIGSDKTIANILASCYGYMQPFFSNPALLRMLSESTFEPAELYDVKTAVFIILPDEKSTCNAIGALLIQEIYLLLIDAYTRRFQGRGEVPHRIDFLCDEFANVLVPDMGAKISAARSRSIRFLLVCQSLSQLEKSYPDDAAVILGNCQNLLFLGSPDPSLLRYISDRSGTTSISEGNPEALISVDMLKRLRKEREYRQAVFLRDDLSFVTRLPDCDSPIFSCYDRFGDTPAPIENRLGEEDSDTFSATVSEMRQDPVPFTRSARKTSSSKNPRRSSARASLMNDLSTELDAALNNLKSGSSSEDS